MQPAPRDANETVAENKGPEVISVNRTKRSPPVLELRFHGRIIEHMGLQMYQSPVNAISEIVANAWDANAHKVEITLPEALDAGARIVIKDDGRGMTLQECQDRFLAVGYNRRDYEDLVSRRMAEGVGETLPEELSTRLEPTRPSMGRKGIGKFAGFGIAKRIEINSVSGITGERTAFEMDLASLIGEKYIETTVKPITVKTYDEPDPDRQAESGTTYTLHELTVKTPPSPHVVRKSLARRFVLPRTQADFQIFVNGESLPGAVDFAAVEFQFPKDYAEGEAPASLSAIDEDGWGTEDIGGGRTIRWRFVFFKDTISEEELRGVVVYAHHKLAQAPFMFNLTGGAWAQGGLEYLSGQVQADYIDKLSEDLIATERQRINWEHPETQPLAQWGQKRLRELLSIWNVRRGQQRVAQITAKLSGFSDRLQKLAKHERKVVEAALSKIATISKLNQKQFEALSGAMLTAWEQGRLKDLIADIASVETMSAESLLEILSEAEALTALSTAEAVRLKLEVITGLERRIAARELENPLRDYIAAHPELISPRWETFRREKALRHVMDAAAGEAGLTDAGYSGRVDLALSSGDHVLVVEFMRPGAALDWDHVARLGIYFNTIQAAVQANTASPFRRVSGLIVADRIEKIAGIMNQIRLWENADIRASDWATLLATAKAQWKEFLELQPSRAPGDERVSKVAHAEPDDLRSSASPEELAKTE